MLAGKWFHRKNNPRNRMPPHHRKGRVADGDGADAAGAGAAAGAGHARPLKLRPAISPRARRPKKPRRRPRPGFPMLSRLEKMLPPSAGRLTKYGKSSNRSNRHWSKWRKCRNWSSWRTARNPPTSVKLNHCAGPSEECSRRVTTRTRRTNTAAARIPQIPASGDGSRRECCDNQTMVCAASQSARAIARRRRP